MIRGGVQTMLNPQGKPVVFRALDMFEPGSFPDREQPKEQQHRPSLEWLFEHEE